jgi:hypothetical protein
VNIFFNKQGWYSLIEHSPKALNYRIFKKKFEFENYCRILEEKDIYIYLPVSSESSFNI